MKNSRTLRRALRSTTALLVLFAALVTALPAAAADQDSHPGVVNINKAGLTELQLLPRVGPALAERILAYREANGQFGAAEDLILVQGIGERTFEMLSTFVVTEGETTLDRKLKTSDVPKADGAQDKESTHKGGESGR